MRISTIQYEQFKPWDLGCLSDCKLNKLIELEQIIICNNNYPDRKKIIIIIRFYSKSSFFVCFIFLSSLIF